jgi:molybdopterin-guanine dinucleotide biosynthesis protein A
MGTPKALLRFGDRPLIHWIVTSLRQRFPEVVVVAAAAADLPPLEATIVRDDVPYQGPIGGLVYGLRASTRDVNFVTACDSPFINDGLVAFFLEQMHDGIDAVVARWSDYVQPLHALYRRGVLPVAESQLARGELRPRDLLNAVRVQLVAEEDVRRFDPDGLSFAPMNTPAEYQRALAEWHHRRL